MKSDELDAQMSVFETAHDYYYMLPGIDVVTRLDAYSAFIAARVRDSAQAGGLQS